MTGHWNWFVNFAPQPRALLQQAIDQIKAQVEEEDLRLTFEADNVPGGITIGDGAPWLFTITFNNGMTGVYDLANQSGWDALNRNLREVWRNTVQAELDAKLRPDFDTMTTSFTDTYTNMAIPVTIRPYPVSNPFSNNPNGPNGPNLPDTLETDITDTGDGIGGGGGAGSNLPNLPDLGDGGSGGAGAGSNLPPLARVSAELERTCRVSAELEPTCPASAVAEPASECRTSVARAALALAAAPVVAVPGSAAGCRSCPAPAAPVAAARPAAAVPAAACPTSVTA